MDAAKKAKKNLDAIKKKFDAAVSEYAFMSFTFLRRHEIDENCSKSIIFIMFSRFSVSRFSDS